MPGDVDARQSSVRSPVVAVACFAPSPPCGAGTVRRLSAKTRDPCFARCCFVVFAIVCETRVRSAALQTTQRVWLLSYFAGQRCGVDVVAVDKAEAARSANRSPWRLCALRHPALRCQPRQSMFVLPGCALWPKPVPVAGRSINVRLGTHMGVNN